ncbi:MAG: 16S rRNA (cytosine(1402)-N(4))-methyltransferase RsmH [Pontixanthobacter sp.]
MTDVTAPVSAPEPTHPSAPHVPVLLTEVIAALAPRPGDLMVDATFGAGGYTRALLDSGATVHAFDRDPEAIAIGRDWAEAHETPPRLVLHQRRFSEMVAALSDAGVTRVDGITMDIGVSSMQLDRADRGFAFQSDGPLDMRMSQSGDSAADFVNTADDTAIADVLYHYGEERQSRRVARAIVAARPIETTGELARVIRGALGHRPGAPKDPATRSFQAIRIHVNAELDELRHSLVAAEQLLGDGGRLAVVAFHSLEDRIVKKYLRDAAGRMGGSRHLPQVEQAPAIYRDVSRAVRAGKAELASNPRARSATLRHAVRTSAPAREVA